jgi:hypothetical protein
METSKTKPQLYQFVGEAIQAFAWRIETAYGHNLSEEQLAKKVIQGLAPSILWNMPKRKGPWTIQELFCLCDNLEDILPADDPHFQVHKEKTLPDFPVVVVNEQAEPEKPRKPEKLNKQAESQNPDKSGRPERKQAAADTICYKCQKTGHFARKCDSKVRVKKTIAMKPRRK